MTTRSNFVPESILKVKNQFFFFTIKRTYTKKTHRWKINTLLSFHLESKTTIVVASYT